jgi:hypothetical protein
MKSDDTFQGHDHFNPLEELADYSQVHEIKWKLIVKIEIDRVIINTMVLVDQEAIKHTSRSVYKRQHDGDGQNDVVDVPVVLVSHALDSLRDKESNHECVDEDEDDVLVVVLRLDVGVVLGWGEYKALEGHSELIRLLSHICYSRRYLL